MSLVSMFLGRQCFQRAGHGGKVAEQTQQSIAANFMRASGRGWALALWMCGLVVFSTCLVYGQGSKKSSEFDATEERDRDHPRARVESFMRWLTAPNGVAVAALRFAALPERL